MPSTQLTRYDRACQAIAAALEQAKSTGEVMRIHDETARLKAQARRAKNRELEADAQEIRFRSERRLGEMLAAQKATVGLNQGAIRGKTGAKSKPVLDPRPTLRDAGIDKKLSSRAQKFAAMALKRFEALLAEWRTRVAVETERITVSLLREGERAQRDAKLSAPKIPDGLYGVILADPPWRYEHVKTESRAIENQYPTMDLDEIKALTIPAAPDCVLFMWATSPKLAESLEVVTAWGFVYRTCAVWDKEVIGMGYYFRQQHELLLVATRGEPGAPPEAVRPPSIIRSKRNARHSEKPVVVYEMIERMYPKVPRLELFAREPREGWAGWGNEVEAA